MKLEENLTRLDGITSNSVEHFEAEGYDSISDLEGVSTEELMEVKYMQEDRAEKILESSKEVLEKMNDSELIYNPADEEYLEEEPENYICDCGSSFPQLSVFLAHWDICSRS